MAWLIEHRRAPVAELHEQRGPLDERRATWCEAERAGLVLGSIQSEDDVDADACAAHAVDVTRRRTGGGAVLVVPDEMLWLDVVVPRGDRLWRDDVGEAMWWLGEVWAEALAACGVGGATVHRGPVLHTPWSRLVCWDSVGAGEVLVGDAKAVGISARRTRDGALLQSSAHLAWQGSLLSALLAVHPPTTALRMPFVLDPEASTVRDAVVSALAAR